MYAGVETASNDAFVSSFALSLNSVFPIPNTKDVDALVGSLPSLTAQTYRGQGLALQ